jgi:hypothetical protein
MSSRLSTLQNSTNFGICFKGFTSTTTRRMRLLRSSETIEAIRSLRHRKCKFWDILPLHCPQWFGDRGLLQNAKSSHALSCKIVFGWQIDYKERVAKLWLLSFVQPSAKISRPQPLPMPVLPGYLDELERLVRAL